MKSELLVTAGQHTAVNMFPGLVHTARHVMGVSNTRSRWANRKGAAVEGGTSDWDEVVNLLRPLAGNGKRQKFGYLLGHPMNPTVLPITTTQVAGDQMEVTNRSVRKISREVGDEGLLTPQRLHAELLVTNEDEDIVHALRRRRGLREQGSRTGRCGWITSFLGMIALTVRRVVPVFSQVDPRA